MAERTSKAWGVRYVDVESPGDLQIYINKEQAAQEIAHSVDLLLKDVEGELSDDENILERTEDIRQLIKKGDFWGAYEEWKDLDNEFDLVNFVGTIEVEEVTIHYGVLDWLPRQP